MNIEDLRYPIGHFVPPGEYSTAILNGFIAVIEQFPKKLEQEVIQLSEGQLETPYRQGGWTIRQVVNHCADSHMNGFLRQKLALTTHAPTINPYPEALWAELADGKHMPVHAALITLKGVHERWVAVLRSLQEEVWHRVYIHPEKGRKIDLQESTGSYAWHCEHHLAHITQLKKRMEWR